ncbi:hypothetical protein ZOD2009_09440 [Haladaptatus paucihalophilus DX253]|uniref:Uncharacterized protein n=2 Tax=Haladaptatus paucihalophilus TaxID=367189 RepID=E7QSZ0_HALPU|nr:hypothetical protein ZOD2009_09440 [Haladaptatus paucihalophilus DX253]SHL62138.1 hypothetical protein SAMN05444342_4279 [Haladaptatus paucihalophilus DX253]
MILLDSEEVEYFQLFTAMEDGPVMLSGCRESSSADYGLFLAHLIQILAKHNDRSIEGVANEGIQRAKELQEMPEG